MATVEGTHTQRVGGRQVRYRCTYEAVRNAIHFKASFDPGTPHEGEFDFDPSKLDAAAAVRAAEDLACRLLDDGGVDLLLAMRVGVEHRAIAEQVDAPRHPARDHEDALQRLAVERDRALRIGRVRECRGKITCQRAKLVARVLEHVAQDGLQLARAFGEHQTELGEQTAEVLSQ